MLMSITNILLLQVELACILIATKLSQLSNSIIWHVAKLKLQYLNLRHIG